jgi:hypothetical protein
VGEHELRSRPGAAERLAARLADISTAHVIGAPTGQDGAVVPMTSSMAGFGSACSKIQSIASSGPAMNPSRDIVTCHSTIPADIPRAPLVVSAMVLLPYRVPTPRTALEV